MAVVTSDLLSSDRFRYQPTQRRIRAVHNGVTVLDSRRALLVWEFGKVVPAWAFPEADLPADAFPPDALRRYEDADLAGHVTIAWHAVDRWLVEDEEALGHPRDPFTRIDVLRSSRHVQVHVDGQTVADSTRARLLFETGLPTRYYLPPEDVHTDLLIASDSRTICPYKGEAAYRSVSIGEQIHRDIVWYYPFPRHDALEVRDFLCFYNEKVDLTLDGERQDRPSTRWS